MFIKISNGKKRSYLSLVQGYRDKKTNNVKHKTVVSFGAVDQLNKKELYNIATKLLSFCDTPNFLDVYNSEEISRRNWGAYKIIEKIWNDFKFDELLKKLFENRKLKIKIKEVMILLLAERLCSPCSKLKSFQKQDYYYGLKNSADLQHIYRTLDELCDYKEDFEKHIFLQNKKQFNMVVDIVFYDVTTFYFESTKSDELRKFGYGKDGKFNEVQVVFGLLTNTEGRPIGFETFAGSTYEGHTFKEMLKKLKEKYNIKKVTIVADRGLNTGINLSDLKDEGYEYIVGSRLKNLGKKMQSKVLDIDSYEAFNDADINNFKHKTIEYTKVVKDKKGKIIDKIKSRIICTWSKKRASKDQKDRNRLVEKAKGLLENNKVFNKRGAQKYIDSTVGDPILNLAKIEDDCRWDGFYGIETSDPEITAEIVLDAYKKLWKIEESFKIFKSHLEARPVYHWSPKRIRGHFVLSYIAFLFERTLELKLKKKDIKNISENYIRESLNEMEFSEIDIDGKRFFMRAKLSDLSKEILKILKIKLPASMSLPEGF